MGFKVVLGFLLLVACVKGSILFGESARYPSPYVSPEARGFFGNLLNKTTDIIGGIKDKTNDIAGNVKDKTNQIIGTVKDEVNNGVNKVTDETNKIITSVTNDAKKFMNTLENGRFCKCSGLACGCCADATLASMKSKFCVNLAVLLKEMSIELSANFNDKTLFSTQLSGKNPPPVCAPLGPIPALSICVRPYELSIGVTGFRVCIQLEASAFGKTVATASFNCFRISSSGTLTTETVDENPDKGYMNLNVSSITSYLPDSVKQPITLPIPGK